MGISLEDDLVFLTFYPEDKTKTCWNEGDRNICEILQCLGYGCLWHQRYNLSHCLGQFQAPKLVLSRKYNPMWSSNGAVYALLCINLEIVWQDFLEAICIFDAALLLEVSG